MKKEVLTGIVTAVAISVIYAAWDKVREIPRGFQIPKGAVLAFHKTGCPDGWDELDVARGRYIVGLRKNGTLGSLVGEALTDKENRPTGQHTHEYTDTWVGGSSGADSVQSGGSYPRPTSKKTTMESEGVKETNAPYIQLLYCEKK